MCQDCGCAIVEGEVKITNHNHSHDHDHTHDHSHVDDHSHPLKAPVANRTITITQSILSQNERLAERNRGYFMAKGITVLNVLSSPGSGKTFLLEKTMAALQKQMATAIIVGDLATDHDAQRLRRSGAEVVQIETGSVCHLEAEMVANALKTMILQDVQLLAIENVGNLVCPAAYDLGETLRVVVFSVTEGEDKPLKYPVMFKTADVVIISKVDLAEAVEFDRDLAWHNIQQIAPQAKILEVSAKTGLGMEQWCQFLLNKLCLHNVSV